MLPSNSIVLLFWSTLLLSEDFFFYLVAFKIFSFIFGRQKYCYHMAIHNFPFSPFAFPVSVWGLLSFLYQCHLVFFLCFLILDHYLSHSLPLLLFRLQLPLFYTFLTVSQVLVILCSVFSILFSKINLFIYLFLAYLSIYFWLCWVFVAARGLSLVAVSRGLLFVAVSGLLTAVASLVAEHGLYVCGLQ